MVVQLLLSVPDSSENWPTKYSASGARAQFGPGKMSTVCTTRIYFCIHGFIILLISWLEMEKVSSICLDFFRNIGIIF